MSNFLKAAEISVLVVTDITHSSHRDEIFVEFSGLGNPTVPEEWYLEANRCRSCGTV